MFDKIKGFWIAFWNAIKTAYNKELKDIPNENMQDYRDTKHINFLAVFVSKLNNLANTESTYDIESDSIQTKHLTALCKEIESNRFEITSEMLGKGDYWVFPANAENGKLFHRYVPQDKVRILNMDGETITDIIGIIDEYVDANNKVYLLNRRQTLNGDTLTIETFVTDERNVRTNLDEWENINGETYQFFGASHIGVGRFKSPISSRGKSSIYGVPLNFGCEEIEKKIFSDLEMIEREFKNAESKVFADPLILKRGKEKTGEHTWNIPEYVFPIDTRGGTCSAGIEIFSPSIRYSEYQAKLIDDMKQYEQQVGTDRGFLTPFDNTSSATATEIRRANASTIALLDRIHSAVKEGVKMTLAADAMFLNISPDLYTVKFDFFDPFEDADKQYERLVSAVERGVLEKSDELQWLYPSMTLEEIKEKLARIEENKKIDTANAVENIINSGT